jgi:hypothetical protein
VVPGAGHELGRAMRFFAIVLVLVSCGGKSISEEDRISDPCRVHQTEFECSDNLENCLWLIPSFTIKDAGYVEGCYGSSGDYDCGSGFACNSDEACKDYVFFSEQGDVAGYSVCATPGQ